MTLAEVLVAMLVFTAIVGGLICGYGQANRVADYAAMSLAATAKSLQGVEIARSAHWDPMGYPPGVGIGTPDELTATNYAVVTNIDFMDIPYKGNPNSSDFSSWVTNYIYVSNYSSAPPLRQIRSDAIWMYPSTQVLYTNTTILLRAPDQ